jgi:hypothetical protein
MKAYWKMCFFFLKFLTGRIEIIPGLPRTDAEKLASVERGMEDYRNGRLYTTEDFL